MALVLRNNVGKLAPRDAAALKLPAFRAKDPISALTHFGGFIAAIIGTPILLVHGALCGASKTALVSMAIFLMSMVLLYGASASYHTFNLGTAANSTLKKLDHMSIFILIAGSYTPFCLSVLRPPLDLIVLGIVWGTAILGIAFKFFWVTCPKWVSSIMYIGMGWTCVAVFPYFFHGLGGWGLPSELASSGIAGPLGSGFVWLLTGGIMYTIGGIIYAVKPDLTRIFRQVGNASGSSALINLDGEVFGNHEIFHIFVLLGSLCHYIVMYMTICRIG